LLVEYLGYAARPGKISEKALVADALETVRLARQRYPGRLMLFGESLGCGVAAAAAADPDLAIDAVVLATPWDKLANVAVRHYPWLPVRLLLRDRYDSVHNLSQYQGDVTIVLAEADEIIPRQSTLTLYDSLRSTRHKRLVTISGSGHNDWFYLMTDAQWREILPE
jgi:alpha-beta hydrolase superfamily lysophospholipase